jgi:RNA polymerase sigma factor (sigma-70 family)
VAYARTLLPDVSAAEDAAQEAFVQAWRDLPRLNEPAAFPAWLRRIVFKYCDRARRTTRLPVISLDAAGHIAGGTEPAPLAESAADAARVRAALDSLPPRERESALLYYLGGRDMTEIAAFLGVPRTTVKNRLHAARKRLRKELWDMAGETLEQEKPSRDEAFAGRVLARIVEEYRQQRRADPHTADRALLGEAHERLNDLLAAPGPLEWESVRAGVYLLWWENDLRTLAALLMRYVAQPLDDSRTAWAHLHLANACACSSDVVGAVYAYEAMERWLPGRHPRLSVTWPYEPAPESAEARKVYDGEAAVRLRTLGQSGEFAAAWTAVGRRDAYLVRVDVALEHAQAARVDPDLRFSCLRMATAACEAARDWACSSCYIDRMYRLAEEPEDEAERAYLRAKALGHDLNLLLKQGNHDDFAARAHESAALLAAHPDAPWVAGQRHDLAHYLTRAGQQTDALPLLEANLAHGGHVNAWGYFLHAATVWHVTQDRPRTLALLRDAAVRESGDLRPDLRDRPEFAAVRDDPEFLSAVRKPK